MQNTTHFSLARVINTFNLLSPPSWFNGPKFRDIFPAWSWPYPTLIKITSLSSPCIVSRFLTKKRSSLFSENNGSNSGRFLRSISSSSRIAFFWATENVPTPKLLVSPYLSKWLKISFTTSRASKWFADDEPLSYTVFGL